MSASVRDVRIAGVLDVVVLEETLRAELSDGRTLSVPTGWYPRLAYATQDERGNWTIIDGGAEFTGQNWTRT